MNKNLFVLVCFLWTNIPFVSSQGLYRQSHSPQSVSENTVATREEIGGFLFESKSALTKPELPGDVGAPVGDGCLILLALIGGYIVYPARRSVFARRSLETNVVNLSVKYRFVIAKAKPEAIHSVCFSWIASLRSQ